MADINANHLIQNIFSVHKILRSISATAKFGNLSSRFANDSSSNCVCFLKQYITFYFVS